MEIKVKRARGQKVKSNTFICANGHLHEYSRSIYGVITGIYSNCNKWDSFYKTWLKEYCHESTLKIHFNLLFTSKN